MLSNGFTAIIDKNTKTYLSHTTSARTGTVSTIIMEKIKDDSGDLFVKIDGKSHYVCYAVQDDYVIVGALPKSELFSTRRIVVGWTAAAPILLCIVTNLALRSALIGRK